MNATLSFGRQTDRVAQRLALIMQIDANFDPVLDYIPKRHC